MKFPTIPICWLRFPEKLSPEHKEELLTISPENVLGMFYIKEEIIFNWPCDISQRMRFCQEFVFKTFKPTWCIQRNEYINIVLIMNKLFNSIDKWTYIRLKNKNYSYFKRLKRICRAIFILSLYRHVASWCRDNASVYEWLEPRHHSSTRKTLFPIFLIFHVVSFILIWI